MTKIETIQDSSEKSEPEMKHVEAVTNINELAEQGIINNERVDLLDFEARISKDYETGEKTKAGYELLNKETALVGFVEKDTGKLKGIKGGSLEKNTFRDPEGKVVVTQEKRSYPDGGFSIKESYFTDRKDPEYKTKSVRIEGEAKVDQDIFGNPTKSIELSKFTEISLDNQGRTTETITKNSDGSTEIESTLYDYLIESGKHGTKKMEIDKNTEGKTTLEVVEIRDSKGSLISKERESGLSHELTTYEYDNQGGLNKIVEKGFEGGKTISHEERSIRWTESGWLKEEIKDEIDPNTQERKLKERKLREYIKGGKLREQIYNKDRESESIIDADIIRKGEFDKKTGEVKEITEEELYNSKHGLEAKVDYQYGKRKTEYGYKKYELTGGTIYFYDKEEEVATKIAFETSPRVDFITHYGIDFIRSTSLIENLAKELKDAPEGEVKYSNLIVRKREELRELREQASK